MRAETQNHVDAIAKSLNLLGQRMDRGTIQHRLEEFDAMIEAPDLWNDPARAQKLMKERQGLIDAWGSYALVDQGLRDNVELIELGEMEGDAEIIAEAEAALVALAEVAVVNSNIRTSAEVDGTFRLTDVPFGRLDLRARRVGYTPSVSTLEFTQGAEPFIELLLFPVPYQKSS